MRPRREALPMANIFKFEIFRLEDAVSYHEGERPPARPA